MNQIEDKKYFIEHDAFDDMGSVYLKNKEGSIIFFKTKEEAMQFAEQGDLMEIFIHEQN